MRTKTQIASAFALTLVAIFGMYRFVMNLYTSNIFFQKRFVLTMSGYSSNRDKLYSFFWHHFIEKSSIMEFFFGHGANGTIILHGQYAHNDWLEFAINQGLLGVILYFVYWCCFILEWKSFHGPKNCKIVLGDLFFAHFLIALFSMSFGDMPLASTLCVGYCLAMNQLKHNYTRQSQIRRELKTRFKESLCP